MVAEAGGVRGTQRSYKNKVGGGRFDWQIGCGYVSPKVN